MERKLKSKFFIILIPLLLIAFLTNTYASTDDTVKVSLPSFPIVINGSYINNQESEYPIVCFNGITYFPMTYYGDAFVGLNFSYYPNKKTIFVGVTERTQDKYPDFPLFSNKFKHLYAEIIDNKIALNRTYSPYFFKNKDESYPFLLFRDITYLPLTYQNAVERLDWKLSFDIHNGLIIDTTNPNRPILDDTNIGAHFVQRPVDYVYSDNDYVIYPITTYNGNYDFRYKTRDGDERTFSLRDKLINGDYHLNRTLAGNVAVDITDPVKKPILKDGVLTINAVVFNKENVSSKLLGHNIQLVIDLEKEELCN